MSELLEAIRRGESRLREFRGLLDRLAGEMDRAWRLENEVGELILRAGRFTLPFLSILSHGVVDRGQEGDLGVGYLLRHQVVSGDSAFLLPLLRTVGRYRGQLEPLLKLSELKIPEPPSPDSFHRLVNVEAEILSPRGPRRVRVVDVMLSVAHGEPRVFARCVPGDEEGEWKGVEGVLDLPLLDSVYPQVRELVGEATSRFGEYSRELERLRDQIARGVRG